MNDDTLIKGLRESLIECEGSRCLYDCGDYVIDQLEKTLSELKSERDRADKAEKRIAELESDITKHVDGANALRHFNAGPQVNPITSEVQDGRWVNAISKSRWNGEAWEGIGMVNGWIGPFDGELPDCVADKCRGIDYGHIPEAPS